MSAPNYWSAAGLIVDMVGVVLLANDLFKSHERAWIDEGHEAHARALKTMFSDVAAQYRALPRTVYTEESIEKLVAEAKARYGALEAQSLVEANKKRAAQAAGVRTNQWRGVWLIVAGFVLQLIGSL